MIRDTFDALAQGATEPLPTDPAPPASRLRERIAAHQKVDKGARDKRARGLYPKYRVQRTDGTDAPGQKHHGCDLFVLDLTHDPHALPALQAYVKACEADGFHALARDLRNRIVRMERAPFLAAQPPENLRYPEGWLMVAVDEGGERFWYAGPGVDAVYEHHRAQMDADMREELALADCAAIPAIEVHDVGGDTEPTEEAERARGFRDVWKGDTFSGVRGTAAMWVAEAARRAKPGDVVPLFSTLY